MALMGIFCTHVGDELCGNAACWATLMAPLSAKVRSLLGPDAIIYFNAGHIDNQTVIPPAFSMISFDHYAGYRAGWNRYG